MSHPFLSQDPLIRPERPMMALVLGNTVLSTVPGISGAGPTPEKTLLTPVLDAELVTTGAITSVPARPNTPTGCPTPATITRAMVELTDLSPVLINAGLAHTPTVPCLDVYGSPGGDPRKEDAVPQAALLFERGETVGRLLSQYSDFLMLGECVPGGTTTALCVLRALGYDASVSSAFAENPLGLKDAVCREVLARIDETDAKEPLEILRAAGDPMMPVAAGIASTYAGDILFAGGTQMLAVAATLKALGKRVPRLATTVYVRDDPSAGFVRTVAAVGTTAYFVDPNFAGIGHVGLARYCIGEVKEGMGAGGALTLAYLMGHEPEEITRKVFDFVRKYA
ncbi:nicotinate mononucleotide-dependent phosphoribosyltransferase CobT [Methanoculleus sp.]|uniref:nicotinate mononucleotide-dependent phosphoribosyltransferase CobT n=1 Tax=Methanoculleus sp. TaxID=90427 RepID=UPI001BD241F8|nr:TIGR00303 family protein [Methanoculleus sp.]